MPVNSPDDVGTGAERKRRGDACVVLRLLNNEQEDDGTLASSCANSTANERLMKGDACVVLSPLSRLNNEQERDGELIIPVQFHLSLQGLKVLHLDIPANRVFNDDGI